jgi:hypothetical protein
METIDSTVMLESAVHIIGLGQELIERLERDVVVDSPEKEKTLWAIKSVIEIQSEAIRRLVEQHMEITDQLNTLIEKHNL